MSDPHDLAFEHVRACPVCRVTTGQCPRGDELRAAVRAAFANHPRSGTTTPEDSATLTRIFKAAIARERGEEN